MTKKNKHLITGATLGLALMLAGAYFPLEASSIAKLGAETKGLKEIISADLIPIGLGGGSIFAAVMAMLKHKWWYVLGAFVALVGSVMNLDMVKNITLG